MTMCKAHRWVTHYKTANINFITSRAADIIRALYYTRGPWGEEINFAVLYVLYVTLNDGPYTLS